MDHLKENLYEELLIYKQKSFDYEEILENLMDGVQVVDKNYIMIWMNKASDYEGIGREELIGKNVIDLMKEGYFSDVVTPKVIQAKKQVSIVASGKNGKEMLLTGTPILKNGEIEKVIINSRDITELIKIQKEITEAKRLAKQYEKELSVLRQEQIVSQEIISNSEIMTKIMSLAKHVARTDATVLILGESGVGKGVVGKFIHNNSIRKGQACIKVDCGAIPANLLESELFGYEEGAFTGAVKGGKIGLIEAANKGTLILDEIGEIPMQLQSKLLTVVQEHKIMKIGGIDAIDVDIRIIAMTNKDLRSMVEAGTFRGDLFYRLNVVPIEVPPLRKRKEDISFLALKFLHKFNEKYKEQKRFDSFTLDALLAYDWPGNVRELENVVEMLIAVTIDETITKKELPENIRTFRETKEIVLEDSPTSYKQYFEKFERELFSVSWEHFQTINEMADYFKLDRSTVRKKLRKYHLNHK